ncbi:MAG: tetratricopeptide repeat protein [Proteobacteria bacterium]|nr:tetratricopeptide repeat protein [Pseudomonadota bacterium]
MLVFATSTLGSLFSIHFLKPFIEIFNPFLGETKELFKILPIHEWQTIDLNLILSFYGLLVIFSILLILKTRFYKIIPFFAFYLFISIKFVRFIDYFALSAFFTMIILLNNNSEIEESLKFVILKYALFFVIFLWCIISYFNNPLIPYGLGMADFFYPQNAIDFMKKNKIKGNIYNSYPFGGYIIYNLFPDSKPIIDGRLCYPLDFIKLYSDSLEDPYAFKNLLIKYKPEIFLLDYNHPNIIIFLDIMRDRYKLVYFDDNSMIFLEKSNKFEDIIRNHEYKHISPQYVMGIDIEKKHDMERVIEEIQRNIKETNSVRSNIMFGNIQLNMGRKDKAKEIFKQVIKRESPIGKAEAYNNLGILYLENNDISNAIKMFKKAIFFNQDFDIAYYNLALIYRERNDFVSSFYHLFRYLIIQKSKGEVKDDLKTEFIEVFKQAIKSVIKYTGLMLAIFGILYILFIKKRG